LYQLVRVHLSLIKIYPDSLAKGRKCAEDTGSIPVTKVGKKFYLAW